MSQNTRTQYGNMPEENNADRIPVENFRPAAAHCDLKFMRLQSQMMDNGWQLHREEDEDDNGELKKIWKSNKGLNLNGYSKSDLLYKTGYEYALVAPLISKNNVKGIIIVGDKESRSGIVQFEKEDLDILSSLASQAGVAIDNAELFQEITNARLFNESIMGSIATGVMTVNLMGEIDSINNAGLRLFNKNKRNLFRS